MANDEPRATGPIWVVLPTYDEAGNLAEIIGEISVHLGEGDRILVVDDDSPDGTGLIADGLARESELVEVLHRSVKAGLGAAYVAGFDRALDQGASLVVQMDADLSHDPADLPAMFEAARDADLVLGSRYVTGGGITDWGAYRRLLSRGGNLYSRMVLGLPQKDLTGGFKCWRAGALEAVDYRSVSSSGYAFQVEMTYRAVEAGLDVIEVPIVFRERTRGESKMSGAIVVEGVLGVPSLRFGSGRRHKRQPSRH